MLEPLSSTRRGRSIGRVALRAVLSDSRHPARDVIRKATTR